MTQLLCFCSKKIRKRLWPCRPIRRYRSGCEKPLLPERTPVLQAIWCFWFFCPVSVAEMLILTDNNQDELIINYNLLKNIVYESCTAYDKVFPPVTHLYRRSSSWPKSISFATATIFSFLIVLLPLKPLVLLIGCLFAENIARFFHAHLYRPLSIFWDWANTQQQKVSRNKSFVQFVSGGKASP